MAEKRNIFLVGPMGAGKSTIGRQLAQQLNMDFVDSDAVIEERAGEMCIRDSVTADGYYRGRKVINK